MSNLSKAYTVAEGTTQVLPLPIEATSNPSSSNIKFPLGQIWLNVSSGTSYILAKKASGVATWNLMSPGASDVDTLSGDSGGNLSPTAGNIAIAGGTNITTVGSGSTITANLDASISLTGVTATTVNATTLDTNVAAAGVTLSGTTLAADGTDANIPISITPKGTGAVTVAGAFDITGDLDVDNLNLNGNSIISTDTNGDINLSPNGTGTVVVNTDLDVDNINVNGNSIISTDTNGDITISPDGTGTVIIDTDLSVDNINVDGNTVSSLDVDGDINLSPNGTGTVVVNTDLSVDNLNLDGNTIISLDTNGPITLAPNGTGTTTVSNGGILVSGGDVINAHSDAGADVTVEVTNSDNTSVASRAGFEVATGGTSAGDPYINFLISGGQSFTMGIDNSSTNDDFVISDSAALGTTDRLVIDGSTGDTSITGNLALPTAATQLQVEGGAVTDFIGQATLSSGTVTVANTNIAATDRIFCTVSDINGSTTMGVLTTSITASTSFTITAVQVGTPASAETGDSSIVDYFIVRSL